MLTPVKLLLIDDQPSFVRGLTRLLERDGYTVETAANGQEALAQLPAHHYDVIVCDLQMPELDGRAFYALLQRQFPLPVPAGDVCHRGYLGGRQHRLLGAVWPTIPVQALHGHGNPEHSSADAARDGGLCMKITSTTDLEFPRLKFAIRHGEVKDLPADPEAAAFIVASVYIREVPEPERQTKKDI